MSIPNPCSCWIRLIFSIVFLNIFLPVKGQLPAAEQEALLDLVQTFNSVPLNWDATNASNACNWQGITCNGDNNTIIQLVLSRSQNNIPSIGGYLSPTIGNLTNIQYIALSGIGLTGALPDEFFHLPQLQYVVLESNQLSTNLSRFTALPSIKQLFLGNNSMVGTIPEFSEGLEALAINLNRNLTGTIPPSLFQLSSIGFLNIANSPYITGTIPPMNMPNLKSLTLNTLNQINGTIPSFDGIPNIEELYLSGLRYITGLMPNMTNLLRLRIIDINNVNVKNCFEISTNALTTCSIKNTLLCSDCKPAAMCTMSGNPTNCNPVVVTPGVAPDGSIITPNGSGPSDGLSQEAIIAIAVVIPVVVVGLAVFLIVFFVRRNKNKKKKAVNRSKSELPEWLKTKKTTNPNFELLEKEIMKLPQKLFTPYEQITVKNLLGVGSFGQVFAGEWQKSQVALKISLSQVSDAFIEEIKLVSDMRPHPNIVQLLGYSIHPDNLNMILIMEFCNGGSLDVQLFDTNTDLSVAQKLDLIKGIALGLNHLHANGIVHRDIAARNILLANGVPKLSDFGMSRQLDGGKKRGTTKADTGPVRWMAPESLRDQSYSPQSDVWMFGVLMYEVFARSEPHANEDPLEVGIKIRNNGYTPQLSPDIPTEVADIMHRCWNIDPELRPTMAEVVTLIKNLEQ